MTASISTVLSKSSPLESFFNDLIKRVLSASVISVFAISKRLGHENIETTLNTYGHLYPDKQKEIALQLNGKYQEELK